MVFFSCNFDEFLAAGPKFFRGSSCVVESVLFACAAESPVLDLGNESLAGTSGTPSTGGWESFVGFSRAVTNDDGGGLVVDSAVPNLDKNGFRGFIGAVTNEFVLRLS